MNQKGICYYRLQNVPFLSNPGGMNRVVKNKWLLFLEYALIYANQSQSGDKRIQKNCLKINSTSNFNLYANMNSSYFFAIFFLIVYTTWKGQGMITDPMCRCSIRAAV